MFKKFLTLGGVNIQLQQMPLEYSTGVTPLIDKLDEHRGALFASGYEYPGRYTCRDTGFYNPPLAFTVKQDRIVLEALNKRGKILLQILRKPLGLSKVLNIQESADSIMEITVATSKLNFSEEERSRQPSVFSLIREVAALFKSAEDSHLGLYGAFGYDLILQFETLKLSKPREDGQRDMVLYLPDEIYVVNHRREEAFILQYDFSMNGFSTAGLPREGQTKTYVPRLKPVQACDHEPDEYAAIVRTAKERFACGDLFEVVPSQTFYEHCPEQPSKIFTRICTKNPSPYGFFINLGDDEYLVGASPEMYVRVEGRRIESCPISGTIKRGRNAIEDAENIQTLLDSEKECSELTMCTDVDRNDKSRICEPGSVKVIGRRQIEMYSRVIHTVDHVEGILREGFDAIDAFLTHMWVVTVTGAPKLWAMHFIEQHEKSPRRWYAGAVGWIGFDGNLNTGLVLRTLRIKEGIAEIRAGATLLFDSIPEAEEQETRLKASAFIELLRPEKTARHFEMPKPVAAGRKKILLIDHEDSFVHTLANYLRQTGGDVVTLRHHQAFERISKEHFDCVVLSPGPGRPEDFELAKSIAAARDHGLPIFGVCLGLQGIVEYYGGSLRVLDLPMHGKPSDIFVEDDTGLFKDLAPSFTAGRYHSLYADPDNFPEMLKVTAKTRDGVIMAVSHKTLPVHAVQFHPETILSMKGNAGIKIIENLMCLLSNC